MNPHGPWVTAAAGSLASFKSFFLKSSSSLLVNMSILFQKILAHFFFTTVQKSQPHN